MGGFYVFCLIYALFGNFINICIGKSAYYHRMGGDYQLGIVPCQLIQPCKQCHLSRGRKCRLRLVQNVQSMTSEAVHCQRHKALAVGLLME